MAFVDFSNAVLHLPSDTTYNITSGTNYASLNNGALTNASGQNIVSNYAIQQLENEQKKIKFIYTGKFTASGTEFYFGGRSSTNERYKMTGISFQSGDTYSFQIEANLTCN